MIDIEAEAGRLPLTVATSARASDTEVTYDALRAELRKEPGPWLVMLGTGWGLTADVLGAAHRRLQPIHGADSYNHLSVRAAAAVILDRLLGTR
jgi:hypothetical protein